MYDFSTKLLTVYILYCAVTNFNSKLFVSEK